MGRIISGLPSMRGRKKAVPMEAELWICFRKNTNGDH